MPDVTLSVALSSYNAVGYLPLQIDSILTQTVLPQQIVFGDAGSTDGTVDVIADGVRRAEALGIDCVVLPSERLLVTPNMARILAACSGDVVVACDHDDVCLPQRFEHVAEMFSADPPLQFVHCEAQVIDEHGAVTSESLFATGSFTAGERDLYARGEAFRVLVRRFLAHGATAAFRRSLFDLCPPIPAGGYYDSWYGLLGAAMPGGAALDARPGLQYRVHQSNLGGGVHRRGLAEKTRMLFAPGSDRNRRLLAQSEMLMTGLQAVRPHVADWAFDLAQERLRHQRVRSGLPVNRLRRAPVVLREARTGAYGRVSRGRKDILLDLVQPLRSVRPAEVAASVA
ncbi:glycosyltransferase [Cellulomonas sp. URHE0023]|uniref:glycosyltransferase n=1 Tax=Cellulomonas sp. URHE0023 TaxID=1380354 RepID=UPI000480B2C2|nr:glycosyltransferase [Cellulomonas sp. URHE0023]